MSKKKKLFTKFKLWVKKTRLYRFITIKWLYAIWWYKVKVWTKILVSNLFNLLLSASELLLVVYVISRGLKFDYITLLAAMVIITYIDYLPKYIGRIKRGD